MMNSRKCVVKLNVKEITIFILMGLKIKMKVNFVFSIKAKPQILNVFPKANLFIKIKDVSN